MHPVPAGTRTHATDVSTSAAAAGLSLRRLPAHPVRALLACSFDLSRGCQLLSCIMVLFRVLCVCVSHSVVSDSVTAWNVARQAPLSLGLSRPEYWRPFPSPGDLPNPGTEPGSPALQEDSLHSEPPGKPQIQDKDRENLQFPCNFETKIMISVCIEKSWSMYLQTLKSKEK